MSGGRTLLVLTRREIVERGRSRAFLLSAAFTVVLVVVAIFIPATVDGGPTTYTIGVTDDAGREVVTTADSLGEETSFEVVDLVGRDAASQALAAGEVDAVLLGGDTLLVERAGGELFGSPLAGILQQAAAATRLQTLLESGGEGTAQVVAVLTSEPLAVEALAGGEATSGQEAFAYGSLLLMYIAILTYGAWTLSGVTEEKASRVVEVLLAAVRPWQLLASKVIGIGALGLAQFAVTIVAVAVTISATGAADLPEVPLGSAFSLLGWFVLGFGLYSVLYATLGSLVSRPEEAQSVSFPVTIVAVIAFFASLQVLGDPDGPLAVAATIFPFTAPFVAPVRLALGTLPAGEAAAAVAVSLATMYGLVRLAGRIYAGGILRFGARVKVREAFRSAEM